MVTECKAYMDSDGNIHPTANDAKCAESLILFKTYYEDDYSPLFGKDGRRVDVDDIISWITENDNIIKAFLDCNPVPIEKEMRLLDGEGLTPLSLGV